LVPLGYFADLLDAARSTLSEDVTAIKAAFEDLGLGTIETVAGQSGGVRFIPGPTRTEAERLITGLVESLNAPERALPGGFVYMTDILNDPATIEPAAEIIAATCYHLGADHVITVETKGIPLAYAVARNLNVPMVVARRDYQVGLSNNGPMLLARTDSLIAEGPVVSVNYVSGSRERIQTMSLPRRAIPQGAKVLVIDDFMRQGGTAGGLRDLLREFSAEVVGVAVLVSYAEAEKAVAFAGQLHSFVTFAGNDAPGPRCRPGTLWPR
jgi:purine operon repressor